ncbi:hypothetical protein Tco_0051492 [Tanacetum coccineum]
MSLSHLICTHGGRVVIGEVVGSPDVVVPLLEEMVDRGRKCSLSLTKQHGLTLILAVRFRLGIVKKADNMSAVLALLSKEGTALEN